MRDDVIRKFRRQAPTILLIISLRCLLLKLHSCLRRGHDETRLLAPNSSTLAVSFRTILQLDAVRQPAQCASFTGIQSRRHRSSKQARLYGGTVGVSSRGDLVGKDDFRAQATQAFENIKTVLAAAGTTPDRIVRLNYYVVGLDDDKLKVLREVRDRYVNTKQPPASTLVGVVRLARPEFQIEIEAVATMP
jgi:enamine deaminase RidA (YjgF/YER057c/UK114 family)